MEQAPFRYIVLLSAGIRPTSVGRWESTSLDEKDPKSGAPGGKERVNAVAILSSQEPCRIFVPAGEGRDVLYQDLDQPLIGDVIRAELEELGIPTELIDVNTNPRTTAEQLVAVEEHIRQGMGPVLIVSNRYHLPRVQAMVMWLELPAVMERGQYVSAEEVLLSHDPSRWGKRISRGYESERMREITAREQEGVRLIQDKTYRL